MSDWEKDFEQEEQVGRLEAEVKKLKAELDKAKKEIENLKSSNKGGPKLAAKPKQSTREEDVPLDDPIAEKKRLEELVRKQDEDIASELFYGDTKAPDLEAPELNVETVDVRVAKVTEREEKSAAAVYSFKTIKDCQTVAFQLSQQILKEKPSSAACLSFLSALLNSCASLMNATNIKTLGKKAEELARKKTVDARMAHTKTTKKANDVARQVRSGKIDFQEELDIFEGGAADDSEVSGEGEEDESEDDDFGI